MSMKLPAQSIVSLSIVIIGGAAFGRLEGREALARSAQGAPAPAQDEAASHRSLPDIARKVRAERAKGRQKPARVFTNADVPSGPGGLSIVGPAPSVSEEEPQNGRESEHGEKYYARAMSKLQSQLDLHQRELSVLQQKLNLAGPQYYPDPNKELQEQTFRIDIGKLTQEIEDKKQQIGDDVKAVADLREQLRREGGDPGWLRQGVAGAGRERGGPEETQPVPPPASDKAKAREYWRARFSSARERLKNAEEEQQLAEDELSLLKTRQAAELSADAQSDIAEKIAAKQAEVETKRAATARVKEALEALQRKFKESGEPDGRINGD